jgi:hypothetical protein
MLKKTLVVALSALGTTIMPANANSIAFMPMATAAPTPIYFAIEPSAISYTATPPSFSIPRVPTALYDGVDLLWSPANRISVGIPVNSLISFETGTPLCGNYKDIQDQQIDAGIVGKVRLGPITFFAKLLKWGHNFNDWMESSQFMVGFGANLQVTQNISLTMTSYQPLKEFTPDGVSNIANNLLSNTFVFGISTM